MVVVALLFQANRLPMSAAYAQCNYGPNGSYIHDQLCTATHLLTRNKIIIYISLANSVCCNKSSEDGYNKSPCKLSLQISMHRKFYSRTKKGKPLTGHLIKKYIALYLLNILAFYWSVVLSLFSMFSTNLLSNYFN